MRVATVLQVLFPFPKNDDQVLFSVRENDICLPFSINDHIHTAPGSMSNLLPSAVFQQCRNTSLLFLFQLEHSLLYLRQRVWSLTSEESGTSRYASTRCNQAAGWSAIFFIQLRKVLYIQFHLALHNHPHFAPTFAWDTDFVSRVPSWLCKQTEDHFEQNIPAPPF